MVNRQNHIAKMDLQKQKKVAAGLVSEHFPKVNGIVINMTYFRKGTNPILMQRTINVFPTAYAYFNMDCMINGCVGGGFDLTPIIKEMIKKNIKQKKGNLVCKGKNKDFGSDHANVSYKVNIKFNKKS